MKRRQPEELTDLAADPDATDTEDSEDSEASDSDDIVPLAKRRRVEKKTESNESKESKAAALAQQLHTRSVVVLPFLTETERKDVRAKLVADIKAAPEFDHSHHIEHYVQGGFGKTETNPLLLDS